MLPLHPPSTGESFDATAAQAGNLTSAWARPWTASPDVAQIHDPNGGWLSRGDLEMQSARRAGRLAALGLVGGDRVLLSAESSGDLVLSYIACLRMGLVVIPTNTAYGRRELEHVITDAGPRAAIVDDPERSEAIAEIAPNLMRLPPRL